MLNKNSLGLLKKSSAKQSRIKSIVRHLRSLVRTRADISLRPNGLVIQKTDIKVVANWIGKVMQGLIEEQIRMYTCKSF